LVKDVKVNKPSLKSKNNSALLANLQLSKFQRFSGPNHGGASG